MLGLGREEMDGVVREVVGGFEKGGKGGCGCGCG